MLVNGVVVRWWLCEALSREAFHYYIFLLKDDPNKQDDNY